MNEYYQELASKEIMKALVGLPMSSSELPHVTSHI